MTLTRLTNGEIHQVLIAYRVIFFRRQHHLNDQKHLAFAKLLGTL